MRSALIKFNAWRLDRKKRALHRSLQWWERERAKGKSQFVVRTALTYGLTLVGLHDVYDNLFKESTQYPDFYLMAVFWPVFGIFVGTSAWDNWESKYQNALREALKAPPPDRKTLPKSY